MSAEGDHVYAVAVDLPDQPRHYLAADPATPRALHTVQLDRHPVLVRIPRGAAERLRDAVRAVGDATTARATLSVVRLRVLAEFSGHEAHSVTALRAEAERLRESRASSSTSSATGTAARWSCRTRKGVARDPVLLRGPPLWALRQRLPAGR